jgi:hypothetical protein
MPTKWKALSVITFALQVMVLAALYQSLYDNLCVSASYSSAVWTYGIPLCCLYAGATIVEDYHGAAFLLWNSRKSEKESTRIIGQVATILLALLASFGIYIVASIMVASSNDLNNLIANFISVGAVLQCDELLANVLKIENPVPDFYKMRTKEGEILEGEALRQAKDKIVTRKLYGVIGFAALIYVIATILWWEKVTHKSCFDCSEVRQCVSNSTYV